MNRFIFIACCFVELFCLRLSGQNPIQPLDVCDLTSHAAEYDGKQVYVRGLWRMTPHGSLLIGSGCREVEVNLTQTPGYTANRTASELVRKLAKKDQFGSVDVVFRAVFRVAKTRQCFGQICAPYQVETEELLSAQAPSR
jgi:hypothetical protein